MPKLKTSRSAAKRFSTTGSGKFRRRRQALRHIHTVFELGDDKCGVVHGEVGQVDRFGCFVEIAE